MSGLAKAQSKRLKASGLQKLRFYCQLCLKQCRDANGFKNHVLSPSHQGRLAAVSTDPNNGAVAQFSLQFESDFLRLLKTAHGTKKINANRYYQEYITNDKHHIHMNSTKWQSLTSFVKHLGRSGKVRVDTEGSDDSELNLVIAYIDPTAESLDLISSSLQEDKRKETEVNSRLLQRQMELGKRREQEKEKEEKEKEAAESKPSANSVSSSVAKGPLKIALKKAPVKKRIAAFDSDSDGDDDDIGNTNGKHLKHMKRPRA